MGWLGRHKDSPVRAPLLLRASDRSSSACFICTTQHNTTQCVMVTDPQLLAITGLRLPACACIKPVTCQPLTQTAPHPHTHTVSVRPQEHANMVSHILHHLTTMARSPAW